MKLIVTGGSGFIGKHLCDILGSVHDLNIIGTQNNIEKIYSFKGKSFPYYSSDYSIESIESILEKVRPNAVVHLAGMRLKPDKKNLHNYMSNLEISANLFQTCLNIGIENIVNISTVGMYSQINELPWFEKQTPTPQNPYSLSKYWVEQTAEYFNNKGLSIKTLRLAQVIGTGEREGYALQVYVKNAKAGLPITIFGKCEGKRHYIYVNDVISAIHAAILKPELKGVFNVGMKNIYGFDELARIINKVYGNKSEIIYNKEAKADENIYQMSVEKAKKELGWEAEFDLEGSFGEMCKV